MPRKIPSEETLNWEAEAEAIIHDVGDHVSYIAVSEKLKNSQGIFLNIKTLENYDFCIHCTEKGFRIVANEFDKVTKREISNDEEEEEEEFFETPYALLNKVSPNYVESFANQLTTKLKVLEEFE